MGDSVPKHTGPISLTDTHLEPERLENPTDHHQRESSEMERRHSARHSSCLPARKSMEHTVPITFPEDEFFDIGHDTRTGVAMLEYRYDVPFKFTGKINKVTFNLDPEQLTEED